MRQSITAQRRTNNRPVDTGELISFGSKISAVRRANNCPVNIDDIIAYGYNIFTSPSVHQVTAVTLQPISE